MSESRDIFTTPRTPPRATTQRQKHGDSTPTASSPRSPSLSELKFLDLSPTAHRWDSDLEEGEEEIGASAGKGHHVDEGSLGGRDLLVQRLSELVNKLSTTGTSMPVADMDTLHEKLDDMEDILSWKGKASARGQPVDVFGKNLRASVSASSTHADLFDQLPDIPLSQPDDTSESKLEGQARRPKADLLALKPDERVKRIMKEARDLNVALVGVVESLKARQEEQDVGH